MFILPSVAVDCGLILAMLPHFLLSYSFQQPGCLVVAGVMSLSAAKKAYLLYDLYERFMEGAEDDEWWSRRFIS